MENKSTQSSGSKCLVKINKNPGTLYLGWLDEEAPDQFMLDCVLNFLRAFLGVKCEMLEVSRDLSRPTHYEQLGITVEPNKWTENKKILISVHTPSFERRAQFSGVQRKLSYDLPKDAAGLIGITRHELTNKMDIYDEAITDFHDAKSKLGVISFFKLRELVKPITTEKGRFLKAHDPKRKTHETARYRQFIRRALAVFVKTAVRFYGLPPTCQVMNCLANNKPFDADSAPVTLCEPCERKLMPNTGHPAREDVRDRYDNLAESLKSIACQLGHCRVGYKYFEEFDAEIQFYIDSSLNLNKVWAESVALHLNEEVFAECPEDGKTYRGCVVSIDEKDETTPIVVNWYFGPKQGEVSTVERHKASKLKPSEWYHAYQVDEVAKDAMLRQLKDFQAFEQGRAIIASHRHPCTIRKLVTHRANLGGRKIPYNPKTKTWNLLFQHQTPWDRPATELVYFMQNVLDTK